MGSKRTVQPVDAIWLNMDRPSNLMVIDSVQWYAGTFDHDRLEAVLLDRLADRYPVFRQRPVAPALGVGLPSWVDDEAFDLRRHVTYAHLPRPGTDVQLQREVEKLMLVSFDRAHPLWHVHVLEGYQGGTAVVIRMHHALADGIALARVMLSLTDGDPEADLRRRPADLTVVRRRRAAQASAAPGPSPAQGSPATGAATGVDPGAALAIDGGAPDGGVRPGLLDGARHAAGLVTRPAAALSHTAGGLVGGVLHRGADLFSGLPPLGDPQTYTDAASTVLAGERAVAKVMLASNPPTVFSRPPGIRKRAVWSSAIPLGEVKRIGRSFDATVNDVLVSALSGAIRSYLLDHGEAGLPDLNTMIPYNLRPLDKPLPRELGNRFALVFLRLPSGVEHPYDRLLATKERMDRIKGSPEAVLTFGISNVIGLTMPGIERYLVNFFADKAIGVTTNVAGPVEQRYLAGVPLVGSIGWVPGSGAQTLGVCIFSYNDRIAIGFKTDAGVIPDPELLVGYFEQELDDLRRLHGAA